MRYAQYKGYRMERMNVLSVFYENVCQSPANLRNHCLSRKEVSWENGSVPIYEIKHKMVEKSNLADSTGGPVSI